MPGRHELGFVSGPEPARGVLANRLEQPIASDAVGRGGVDGQQRCIDQTRKWLQHIVDRAVGAGLGFRRADRLNSFQSEAAGEDRQPAQQLLLTLAEQVVTPGQCGGQRLLSGQGTAVTPPE